MDSSGQCFTCLTTGLVGTQGLVCAERPSTPDADYIIHWRGKVVELDCEAKYMGCSKEVNIKYYLESINESYAFHDQ